MSHRITMQDLKNVLRRLNDIAGQKQDAWEMLPEGGTHKSNPGTYIIDICYGGEARTVSPNARIHRRL